ncbi:hypothetical protein SAMN05444507_113134 [Pseudomonas syringae]|nr:hypothetical protein SAMN05444507_113134 [Pseudomonas syringae]
MTRIKAGKLLGEPKLPQSVCSLLLFSAWASCFCLVPIHETRVCETSQSGVKSKRIALVAALQ